MGRGVLRERATSDGPLSLLEHDQLSHTNSITITTASHSSSLPHHAHVSISTLDGEELQQLPSSATVVLAHKCKVKKDIHLVLLTVLIYYGVSGGPFGIETAVQAAGPLLTLIGLGVLPTIWSAPEAALTAELSTAFPEASGFVAWVSTAFGPRWGFLKGYWGWTSGICDNSLYAVLLLDYVLQVLPPDSSLHSGFPRVTFQFLFVSLLTILNLLGLKVVGNTALCICVFSLLPFLIMSLWGQAAYAYPENWTDLPEGGLSAVDWGIFLNSIFWSTNYFDNAASFAGLVQEPERTFPKAMGWAIVMVIVTNVVPVLNASAAFADPDYSLWVDGFFATAARQIGGEWLSVWIVAGAASSNIGLFEAEMSSDSLQIQGMAENGMLPRFLSKRSRFGTPLIATLMSAVGALSLSFFEFSELLEVLNFMYCLGQLLEFAAFLHLRITQPDLVRPWRIPLGTAMCAVCLVPATTFILALMVISKRETKYICLSIVVSGFVLHWLLGIARRNHWCEFNELVVNGQACGTAVEYVMTDEISTTSREDEEEDGL